MTIRVSLVVPLQDEEATVCTLLASIAEQTRPPDELVLVDAGSHDQTRQRIKSSWKREGLRVVHETRIHPGSARNAGVRAASHSWLAFTDAGIRLDPSWLERLIAALGDPPGDVVFGSIEPVCENTLQECAAIAYVPPRTPEGIRGPSVASMLLRRTWFEDAGGFPSYRAAEDLVFLERLLAAKPGVRYAPHAHAHWSIPGTVLATYRRFELYSFHNLAAGRGRHWHCGVARLYCGLALLIMAAVLTGQTSWALPLAGVFFFARAGNAAWTRRKGTPFRLRAIHVVGAAGLLAIIDVATLVGAVRWLVRGRPRLG